MRGGCGHGREAGLRGGVWLAPGGGASRREGGARLPPRCFLKVSRLEAQLLLERYPDCGNLLLRPSGDGGGGVSVTTRQLLNGCACAEGRGRVVESDPKERPRGWGRAYWA